MRSGRRGFIGGLLSLPFVSKVAPIVSVPPPPPPTATVLERPALVRVHIRRRSPQNVGWFCDGPLPSPAGPTTYQGWENQGTEPVTLYEGGHSIVLAPGARGYFGPGGKWVKAS